MQTSTNPGAAGTQPPHHARDVVAGLVNDGLATLVAATAVREAVQRGSRVRFVQVLPLGLSAEDRSDMDVAMFGVALRALHRQRRVPCTFETVEGDAALTLVERSRGAAVLVVGCDAPDALLPVGKYCLENAWCEVLTVTGPDQFQSAGDTEMQSPVQPPETSQSPRAQLHSPHSDSAQSVSAKSPVTALESATP
jgi:hypothetical protein